MAAKAGAESELDCRNSDTMRNSYNSFRIRVYRTFATVDSKSLTKRLNPLAAMFTKNWGVAQPLLAACLSDELKACAVRTRTNACKLNPLYGSLQDSLDTGGLGPGHQTGSSQNGTCHKLPDRECAMPSVIKRTQPYAIQPKPAPY